MVELKQFRMVLTNIDELPRACCSLQVATGAVKRDGDRPAAEAPKSRITGHPHDNL